MILLSTDKKPIVAILKALNLMNPRLHCDGSIDVQQDHSTNYLHHCPGKHGEINQKLDLRHTAFLSSQLILLFGC